MAQTTIEQFASELKMPSGALLEQLAAAGVSAKKEGDKLTEVDKTRLLDYLRKQHGAAAEPKKRITLTRKQTTEIKAADSTGKARTIQVEVRKKRVLVRRDEEAAVPAAAEEPPVAVEVAPQVVAEALGLSLPHTALAPSGHPLWLDAARRSAFAMLRLLALRLGTADVLTQASVQNAMVVHAAFGGSTNLLLHLPAVAYCAGLKRPSVPDWEHVNRSVPRLVDALPNGPQNYATVQVFLAGGVPEVMLHLRRAGLLDLTVTTAAGATLDNCLDWWEQSERRSVLRKRLTALDGVNTDDVIMDPDRAKARGLRSTLCFPVGNIAPEGAVIKSTAIDPSVLDASGCYRKVGAARVYTSEATAIAAIKDGTVVAGDVVVVMCGGPMGSGMQEIYQVTSALKQLPFGKHVAVITDARFSGVSTGACIGHVSPEALAGGAIGKLQDGDQIEILIDPQSRQATVNFVGEGDVRLDPAEATRRLFARSSRADLTADPRLPDDTRLWAALVHASGGIWAGCVYDTDAILVALDGTTRT